MRTLILITIAALPLLAVTSRAAATPVGDVAGFSSEDWGSGSYLGVDTRDVTSDRLAPLHLKDERGVEVTMVDQDAPAGKAGLKENDVILTMNGTDVQSVEQLRRMIHDCYGCAMGSEPLDPLRGWPREKDRGQPLGCCFG